MTSVSSHDTIGRLLGAYSLDAVDPQEAALVEAHLETCGLCRAEVAEHRGVAAHLAHSYEEPPAGLWDQIALQVGIDSERRRSEGAQVSPIDSRGGRPVHYESNPEAVIARMMRPKPEPVAADGSIGELRSRRRLTVALAAAVLVVVALAGVVGVQRSRMVDLESPSLADSADVVTTAPGTRSVQLVGDGVEARAVVTPQRQGYLFGGDLPDLPEGRTYQLWSVTGGGAVSLGVLGASPDVVAFAVPVGAEAIAVTDEPETGVAQPSSDPLAIATLPV